MAMSDQLLARCKELKVDPGEVLRHFDAKDAAAPASVGAFESILRESMTVASEALQKGGAKGGQEYALALMAHQCDMIRREAGGAW